MAILYLRSTDGNNSDNGSTWALAKATLAGAFAAAAAGDTIYMSHVHAETVAADIDLTSPGTAINPVKVICANDGAEPPTAVATSGTITSSTGYISLEGGFTWWYGVSLTSFTQMYLGNAARSGNILDSCVLRLSGTSGSDNIKMGTDAEIPTASYVQLRNCTLKFGAVGQYVVPRNGFKSILGGSIDNSGTAPTNFIRSGVGGTGQANGQLVLEGFDASYLGSNVVVGDLSSSSNNLDIIFRNCKLGSGGSIINVPQVHPHNILVISSDSAGTNYRQKKYTLPGSQIEETTIVRTGGATDGTTPISWKIDTTANSSFTNPYESIQMAIWNDSTSSVTATVYGYIDQAGLPNNDEIWCEFHYMASSGSPIATVVSNGKADFLASAAAQGSDSSTWGGGDTTTRFKMSSTFTPAMKGPIYAIIKGGKASTTFYADPKIVLT